jgi:hypothetical protein
MKVMAMTSMLPTYVSVMRNDNGGIVPPWLREEFHILPMPDDWMPDDAATEGDMPASSNTTTYG